MTPHLSVGTELKGGGGEGMKEWRELDGGGDVGGGLGGVHVFRWQESTPGSKLP